MNAKTKLRLATLERTLSDASASFDEQIQKAALETLDEESLVVLLQFSERGAPIPDATPNEERALEKLQSALKDASAQARTNCGRGVDAHIGQQGSSTYGGRW
jgi:hypothetical protein